MLGNPDPGRERVLEHHRDPEGGQLTDNAEGDDPEPGGPRGGPGRPEGVRVPDRHFFGPLSRFDKGEQLVGPQPCLS
eukprot:8428871-Pyramimonas_sp.AAC.1